MVCFIHSEKHLLSLPFYDRSAVALDTVFYFKTFCFGQLIKSFNL